MENMAKPWEKHVKNTVTYCDNMGKSWETHGKIMGHSRTKWRFQFSAKIIYNLRYFQPAIFDYQRVYYIYYAVILAFIRFTPLLANNWENMTTH